MLRMTMAAALIVCLLAPPAWAGQRRYAVVIGTNQGDFDERRLQYAEADASRVADVLARLGGVAAEDIILLRDPDAEGMERMMGELARRIADGRERNPEAEPVLFLFYSGHASAQHLHLGGTKISLERLAALVRAAGAAVSVLVVDACKSGALTRIKGAKPSKAFQISVRDKLDTSGMAIIASSAAGEDAQESDRLKGGVFTHHFINGLLGAADTSEDRRVTLSEAYRYAHSQTIATTSRTDFTQHPTFSFRLSGQKELVLTELDSAAGLGRLELKGEGRYVLIQKDGEGVAAELEAADRTEVLVYPGDYVVRRRYGRLVFEQRLSVKEGETRRVDDMVAVPFGRSVRKGYTPNRSVWSLIAGAEVAGGVLAGASVGGYGVLGAQVDLSVIALNLRVRYGRSSLDATEISGTQDMLGADLGAFALFDLPRAPLSLGLGLRVGVDWFRQTFETSGVAPNRHQAVFRFAPIARLEWAMAPRWTLSLDGGAETYLLHTLDPSASDDDLAPRIVPFGGLTLGVYL